ncbi:MAG: glutamyl-tRNA(Gln) amidotransferase subunit E [Bacteroidetes bacterium GWE2_29_8]|nr:MAG: glutamyl-tRNA(Gln) amidotransferase subunit E [Bacteroidetes bacterium GWE2_29_8]
MKQKFDPKANYEATKNGIGYVPRKEATQKNYDEIGFMSGLEVHQQVDTEAKSFCRCPAGMFNSSDIYDAEIIRHMRPTLSELGEYDGTALMEFRTKKEIVYRIKNETACTYEVDDTPPFPLNREALEKAIVLALASKLNIVGEVHITRKQYLDGSIPTGFQRTAIIGVEGEIQLSNKKVRLIQLSLEEDSCREISDIGHRRVYKTDRLGMPLIETVTYPDMVNPDEVKEAANYIRFLNRSTGLVRTGIGAGREDVNVSCTGGTRVEIKGVAHNSWIPELTHNECYRQWALLNIKNILNSRGSVNTWKAISKFIDVNDYKSINNYINTNSLIAEKVMVILLPNFKGLLSHFTQPKKAFANEISDRLKVIACIEKPNMTNSEDLNNILDEKEITDIFTTINGNEETDAFVVLWGPESDMKTALETVEERCVMAFKGVPEETRKSFKDGTTIFERVLPGADRMYPDTDSAPIPVSSEYIDSLKSRLPIIVSERINQLKSWGIPSSYNTYILSKNLIGLVERIITELGYEPKFVASIIAGKFKSVEGRTNSESKFNYERLFDLFKFVKENNLDNGIINPMLKGVYKYPNLNFETIIENLKIKQYSKDGIIAEIKLLKEEFNKIGFSNNNKNMTDWIMGKMKRKITGSISLKELRTLIVKEI